MKVEWTSVLGSRAFLDVLAGNWYNFFPLRPVRDFGLYDGPWTAGRLDTATNLVRDGGPTTGYQDQKRFKPQAYATLSYYKDGWGGSHDFKVGYDWKRDRRKLFNDQPFDIFYRDNNGALAQVDLFNSSVTGTNDVVYNAGWINDTWKVTSRLTVNVGLRFEAYRDGWGEQSHTPNGQPALAGWTDARYTTFIAPRTVAPRTVANTKTVSPKVGFAYDLTGDNRTVFKVFVGQSRWNSADTLADQENPVGLAQLRYAFVSCSATVTTNCDLNGNRVVDSPAELGAFALTQGGGGFVRVDRDLVRPTSNEVSVNLEREIASGLSGRASYVYKNMRNVWGEIDAVRTPAYTAPFTFVDPGVDRTVGTGDDKSFTTLALPTGVGTDRVYTNPEGNDADFHNMEFAVNRRFSGKWMMLTSLGYTWSTMLHAQGGGRTFSYRPSDRMFGDNGVETTTQWNYKIIGRYVLPYGIGMSGSWKVQSGFNYGRTVSVTFPVEGARAVRVEPINSNRYPTVQILDVRLDKAIGFGKFGKAVAQLDVFNLTNSAPVTGVRLTNTATAPFNEVLGILNPRVVRVGLRFNF